MAGHRSDATIAAASRMWMLPRYRSEATTGITRNSSAHGPVSHSSASPISSVQSAWNTSNGSLPSTAKTRAAGGG